MLHNKLETMEQFDKIVHLSHNDLDGYGCSWIVGQRFPHAHQVNINYGEILEFLNACSDLTQEPLPDWKQPFSLDWKKTFLLVTDLNLTEEECQLIQKLFGDWLVLDHHVQGQSIADKFPDKYYIDGSRSATLITKMFMIPETMGYAHEIVLMINSYDIYQVWYERYFNAGAYLAILIKNSPFEAPTLNSLYTRYLFREIGQRLVESSNIFDVESKFPVLLKQFLEAQNSYNANVCTAVNTAIAHKDYINDFVEFENDSLIVIKGVSSNVTQYLNDVMFDDKWYDKVVININTKTGNTSFRSKNNKAGDLAKLCGGGGHPNAGGCQIQGDDKLKTLFKQLKVSPK